MAHKILVVDDDPTIVKLISLNLELDGYDVVTASNGREAIEAVSELNPDLVLMDVMMPVMNGLEAVARLKRDPSTAAVPVVMLSAKAQDLDVEHGKEAGADDYLTKPFDPEDLLAVIRRLLENAG